MIDARILSDKYLELKKWAEEVIEWMALDWYDEEKLDKLIQRHKEITKDDEKLSGG